MTTRVLRWPAAACYIRGKHFEIVRRGRKLAPTTRFHATKEWKPPPPFRLLDALIGEPDAIEKEPA